MARQAQKNLNQSVEQVNNLFDIDGEKKTTFKIDSQEDGKKILNLLSGSWDEHIWFGLDEKDREVILISDKYLDSLISFVKRISFENFNLKLEKSIFKHHPVDFEDVLSVCMDEIYSQTGLDGAKLLNLNLDDIVSGIKYRHPNLFFSDDNTRYTKV